MVDPVLASSDALKPGARSGMRGCGSAICASSRRSPASWIPVGRLRVQFRGFKHPVEVYDIQAVD